MSERESGSDWVAPFTWGFVLGVLVCLGVGGGFYFFVAQRQEMEARRAAEMREMVEKARHEAEQARMEALRAEQRARMEADRAREALRRNEAKKGKGD